MNPSCEDNCLFLLVFLKRHSVCDGQVLALVACNGSAQGISRHVIQVLGLNFAKVIRQVCVSVWLRVRKKYLVVVKFKCMREGERVVVSLEVCDVLLLIVVLIVADIIAASVPASLCVDSALQIGCLHLFFL